jgi:linoleoyl-CoA desaturase
MQKKITYQNRKEDLKDFKELRINVMQRIGSIPRKRILVSQLKAVATPFVYFSVYVIALHNSDNPLLFHFLYGCMGIIIVLSFLNLIHEVVHETLFSKKYLNRGLLLFFDIIGANSFIWKNRHLILHHNYANIKGWDSDIEQADFFRVFPQAEKKSINKYQHRYMFLLYPFYLVNWVFIRDFKDFFSRKRDIRKVCSIPIAEYFKLFVFKLIFLAYILIIPYLLGLSFVFSLSAMLFMLIVAGSFALIILLTPHVNINNSFPMPNQSGEISCSWLYHQFNCTNDVTANNWVIKNFMGNFNYHLAHHLFPKLSYVYAAEITDEVKRFAGEKKYPYKRYTLVESLKLHYYLIKNNALTENILEEDM